MAAIEKILVTSEGTYYYLRDLTKDYHTEFGFLKADDLKTAKPGDTLTTNKGVEMHVLAPTFTDLSARLNRGAQIITPKDIGPIIAYCGVNRKTRVIDAGAGSGALACALANVARDVVTYDLRDDFIAIVEKNKQLFRLTNLTVKKGDICAPIPERNRGLFTLDIPEPWRAISTAAQSLAVGGFLVSYSPTIPQVMQFADAIKASKKFLIIKTLEVIEREWHVEGIKVRPHTMGLVHTGFLTFCRKISR